MQNKSIGGGKSAHLARQIAMKNRQLKSDTSKAAKTTVTTHGGASKKASDKTKSGTVKDKTVKKKESVVLSQTVAEPESKQSEELQEAPQQKVERQQVDQQPQVQNQTAPEVRSEEPQQREATPSEQKFSEFVNVFSENTSQKEQVSLTMDAQAAMMSRGVGEEQAGQFVAATALRHATKEIKKKMPEGSPKEIREAAKKDPELARWVNVADSAGGYLNEVKKESAQAGGNGSTVNTSPDVPVDGKENGPGMASDPFAEARGEIGGGSQGPGGPPGTDPMENYKLDPKQQAELMAEQMKTMSEINTIYTQMWADMKKQQAQRHQIMMETMREVSEMFRQTHIRRQQGLNAHHNSFVSLITESA